MRKRAIQVRYSHFLREGKKILSLGIPGVLTQLLFMSMGIMDTIMVGQLGADQLSAAALGTSLILPFVTFGNGIVVLLNPIVSQLLGEKQEDQIASKFWPMIWVSQFLGWAAWWLIRHLPLAILLPDIDPLILPMIQSYLMAVSWGVPFCVTAFAIRNLYDGISYTRPIMLFTFLASVMNFFMNTALIYGEWGMPAMGAEGAGWSTSFVFVLLFLMSLSYLRHPRFHRFQLFNKFEFPKWVSIRDVLKIGIPNSISRILEIGAFTMGALFVARLGSVATAGHNISQSLFYIAYMVAAGISFATSTQVSFSMGRRQPGTAGISGYMGLMITLMMTSLVTLLMVLFSIPIIRIFTPDPLVQQQALSSLLAIGLCQFVGGFLLTGAAALRGLKDTVTAAWVTLISYWIIGLPLGYYLCFQQGWGSKGIWFAFSVGILVGCVIYLMRFRHKISRLKQSMRSAAYAI